MRGGRKRGERCVNPSPFYSCQMLVSFGGKKEGVNVKVRAIPSKISFFLASKNKLPNNPSLRNAFSNVFKLMLSFIYFIKFIFWQFCCLSMFLHLLLSLCFCVLSSVHRKVPIGFHEVLSRRRIHSILHIHQSGPSLRSRCSFVKCPDCRRRLQTKAGHSFYFYLF